MLISPLMHGTNGGTRILNRCERGVRLLLPIAVIVLLLVRVQHAGALWRDECAALNLARLPTYSEVIANFSHEAFPLLFPTTLRAYTGLFGSSDIALRWFGFVVGILFVMVAWFNSYAIDRGPSLLLALIGTNITFLISGTSVRGYGLGSVLLLLTLGLAVRALLRPSRATCIALLLAAIASVQCLVNNVPMVATMALAAAIALLTQRRLKATVGAILLALICAFSFVPYLSVYLNADWNIVLQYPIGFHSIGQKLILALGQPQLAQHALWLLSVGLMTMAACWQLRRRSRDRANPKAVSLVFLAAVIVLSLVAYYLFLRRLGYPTRPWYYLALLCAVAGAVDLIAQALASKVWVRWMRLALITLAVAIFPLAGWSLLLERQTNIDIVARYLEEHASTEDLIVINAWHYAISFHRYYSGAAESIAVPNISERRFHRYDLLKAKMLEADPLVDVRAMIARKLKAGHAVWILGGARPPEENLPTSLAPPPDPVFGWNAQAYTAVWSMQLGAFLQQHVVDGELVLDRAPGINVEENIPLLLARGWHN